MKPLVICMVIAIIVCIISHFSFNTPFIGLENIIVMSCAFMIGGCLLLLQLTNTHRRMPVYYE